MVTAMVTTMGTVITMPKEEDVVEVIIMDMGKDMLRME